MSQHNKLSTQLTQNQKNGMSDDPGDGARNSSTVGRAGGPTPLEKAPDAQDQEEIEAFGRAGEAKARADG